MNERACDYEWCDARAEDVLFTFQRESLCLRHALLRVGRCLGGSLPVRDCADVLEIADALRARADARRRDNGSGGGRRDPSAGVTMG